MSFGITNLLFGTSPIAAHCPGPLHESWHRMVATVMAQPRRQCDCSDVTIITWNNADDARPDKPGGVLERSLERLGVRTLVLGQGLTNWRNRQKIGLTADALKTIRTPYVIGADSCDVIFWDNPRLAVERFKEHFACDLVFNATGSRCWPELPEFVQFESSRPMAKVAQNRHWLNAGLFVGRTEFCREYFQTLAAEPAEKCYEASEQAIMKRTWPRFYPRVQLDYFSQMFQWFNEDRRVMRLERGAVARQQALVKFLKRLPAAMVGAEVGVFEGHTSEVLLREFPEMQLWMVDPWKPFEGAAQMSKLNLDQFRETARRAKWWTDFAADRRFILPEISPGSAQRFANGSLDFVFVDANHLYEHVRADIAAWWPKVRDGGLLTGHDYGVYGDARGEWGVKRAVDEFADNVRRVPEVGADGVWCIAK